QDIAPAAAVNGLAQTVLRLTAPGIPDLYQGTEWWDFSLVDPDNRRPVDYVGRSLALESSGSDLAVLMPHWRDGRIKQAVIRRILQFRARNKEIFEQGAYRPLQAAGVRGGRLVAFALQLDARQVFVVVPRLCADPIPTGPDAMPRIDMTNWKDTGIMVSVHGGCEFKDLLTGRIHRLSPDAPLRAEHLLAKLPCAVLTAA